MINAIMFESLIDVENGIAYTNSIFNRMSVASDDGSYDDILSSIIGSEYKIEYQSNSKQLKMMESGNNIDVTIFIQFRCNIIAAENIEDIHIEVHTPGAGEIVKTFRICPESLKVDNVYSESISGADIIHYYNINGRRNILFTVDGYKAIFSIHDL